MWIAVIVACALALSSPPQAAQPAKRIDLHWIYVREGLKWETPPRGAIKECQVL